MLPVVGDLWLLAHCLQFGVLARHLVWNGDNPVQVCTQFLEQFPFTHECGATDTDALQSIWVGKLVLRRIRMKNDSDIINSANEVRAQIAITTCPCIFNLFALFRFLYFYSLQEALIELMVSCIDYF